jgi:hypothetical protein
MKKPARNGGFFVLSIAASNGGLFFCSQIRICRGVLGSLVGV